MYRTGCRNSSNYALDWISAPNTRDRFQAQFFAGISLQLFAAQEAITKAGDIFNYVERAYDLAQVGLGEAPRSALSLRSDVIEESGLTGALRMLADRSNIPGRLRCSFRANDPLADDLPHQVQQHLLRIAQEAISNAIRHADPIFFNVLLQSNSSELVLEIDDNERGMATARLGSSEGFGLANMRERAKRLGAELDVRAAPGGGTSVIGPVALERRASPVGRRSRLR